MKRKFFKQENMAQAEAIEMLIARYALTNAARQQAEVKLCEALGKDFRDTINKHEADEGRVSTPDELLWFAGEHMGRDPGDIIK